MRGYYGIGVENIKNPCNVGSLYRSAHALGASFIFCIGNRYKLQKADTTKAYKHVPMYEYDSVGEFLTSVPRDCELVAVEYPLTRARPLRNFVHPERAIYILGAEDTGLSPEMLHQCKYATYIETSYCLNVAVAGSIIMYDRRFKSDATRF